jgi:hypothetical protein
LDSYKNDIEVVATSLDIIDGQMPNKSEIQIEDAKRKDNSNLGIDPDKIYVSYFETSNWGWNGKNF